MGPTDASSSSRSAAALPIFAVVLLFEKGVSCKKIQFCSLPKSPLAFTPSPFLFLFVWVFFVFVFFFVCFFVLSVSS